MDVFGAIPLSSVQSAVDDSVVVYEVDRAANPVCSRTNCGNPMKAGLALYTSNGLKNCNSGFVMRGGTTTYYLSMAGHCFTDPSLTHRYHPVGTVIGNIDQPGWQVHTADHVDAALINISVTQASNKSMISNTTYQSITSKENPANEVIGETVCSSKPSATSCGYLVSVVGSTPDGKITQLRVASGQYACGGDSGSPVYYGNMALGIIDYNTGGTHVCPDGSTTGSNALYSHIRNIEIQFNVQTQLAMP
jgi:hypothetical protein